MNLLLLKESDFVSPEIALVTGRRLEHARSVLKLSPGDSVKAGIYGGMTGQAKVVSVTKESLELWAGSFSTPPPPPIPLTLIVALPRPQSLKKLLHFTASSGVKRLFLIASSKVEKSYWSSSALEPEAVEEEVLLGLEQGVDTVPPKIELRKRFKPFVEDELPSLGGEGALKFIAHPGVPEPCPGCAGRECLLAIGPEGGFIDYELDLFSKAGFKPVSVGARILRVEFAAAFISGMLLRT